MAQLLQSLSVISFAIAGVCLVLAVFFWFFFKIPTVIGDLSGRTARKSIAKMRAANEKSGVKAYRESKTNAERGKITGTMHGIGRSAVADPAPSDGRPETGVLAENKAEGLDPQATGALNEETAMLDAATTELLVDENATVSLNVQSQQPPKRVGGKKLEMLDQVMLIHTDEVIE